MITPKAIALIQQHEGLRLTPYKDSVGVLTVGYGHNLEKPITEAEAHRLLEQDLQETLVDCRKLHWFHTLDDVRQAVIINMVFNLGITRFKRFVKTIEYIEKQQYFMAASEMLNSKWAKQVKGRAIDLSYMMRTGEWQ